MDRRLPAVLLLVALAAAVWTGCVHRVVPASAPPTQPRVLLVTWDGAKPSVLKSLLGSGDLPNLNSLVEGGAWTLTARVEGPTLTLPSHVTLVTGLPATAHGVTWNKAKPELGAVRSDTLFDLCSRAGLRSALIYGKKKFLHILKPGAPDRAVWVQGGSMEVARTAAAILRDGQASFVMVHFAKPDAAGESYGWGNDAKGIPPSRRYLEALRGCDAGLGVLLEACEESGWDRTLVIVTADHGGHDDTHGTDDPEDALVPWISGGGLAEPLGELIGTVRSTDTAPTVLEGLGLPGPSTMQGRPVACLRGAARKAA